MEKVKLPKEIADALDYLKSGYDYPIRKAVDLFGDNTLAIDQTLDPLIQYFQSDRSRRIGLIMQALINGYEVEQTPEEKVRVYYLDQLAKIESASMLHDSPDYAIEHTLELLGIKIPGVNT